MATVMTCSCPRRRQRRRRRAAPHLVARGAILSEALEVNQVGTLAVLIAHEAVGIEPGVPFRFGACRAQRGTCQPIQTRIRQCRGRQSCCEGERAQVQQCGERVPACDQCDEWSGLKVFFFSIFLTKLVSVTNSNRVIQSCFMCLNTKCVAVTS